MIDRLRAVALEFCDESDIRYYERTEEYHVVTKKEYQSALLSRFRQMGWGKLWIKENTREGWNRIAFKQLQKC